ncbi:hypothetical protein [Bradyrhizobium sp. HKCCYLR1023]|uniref:hypothetical protein n=1 Tax=Bradyrhizobium TaxID=374 RepID=UPI003EBB991C
MKTLEYRGYILRHHKTDSYFCLIYRPGSNVAMSAKAVASAEEGEAIMLARAKAIVDAEEAKKDQKK